MNIISKMGGLLLASLMLGACGASVSAEEAAVNIQERAAEVVAYEADIQFELDATNVESGAVLLDTKSLMDITINEETKDNFGQVNVESMGSTVKQEYYSIGEQAFMRINDSAWTDVSDMQAEYFQNEGTFYETLVPVFQELAESAEMTAENGSLTFSFEGANAELFEAFAVPYQLQVGGIAAGDIQHQVVAKVNEETFLIESVENLLTGKDGDHSIQYYISHRFNNINNVEDFTIPQEIIEEASDL